jgi:hypothetical protein
MFRELFFPILVFYPVISCPPTSFLFQRVISSEEKCPLFLISIVLLILALTSAARRILNFQSRCNNSFKIF